MKKGKSQKDNEKAEPSAKKPQAQPPQFTSRSQNNLIAAATENEDHRENDYPRAVIVKEMAEAVVVHICSSKVSFERWLISILCRTFFLVIGGREIFKKEVFEP